MSSSSSHRSGTRAALAALAGLLAAVAAPGAARAQQPILHPDTAAAVDQVFARYSGSTPGCAAGVARDGREIFARGYGLAELEHQVPIRPATIFEAGSVSKQFTAFLVLLLERDGRLSLDDPLRKHLPELPDYGAPLTIRHVLTHTSGLRDWYGIAEAQGLLAGEHHFRNADLLDMASRQHTLNFPSGTEYLYSNTGWNIMAILIERVSGESFQSFSQRRLFEPLGMARTTWRDDFRAVVPGRAPAYAPANGRTEWRHAMPLMSIVGAGGLLTTVHDLLRWNENLTTGRVGGRDLVSRMATPARLANGREIRYGLGLRVAAERGIQDVGHGGSTGGYRAHLVRYPERALSIAILCNEAGAGAQAYASAVADVFLGKGPVRDAAATSTHDLEAIRGLYRNTRTGAPVSIARTPVNRVSVHRRDGEQVTALLSIDADGDTTLLERVEPWTPAAAALQAFVGQFRTEEAPATWRTEVAGDTLVLRGPPARRIALQPAYADVFRAPGLGHVRFHRDAGGSVVAMSFLMGRVRDMRLSRIPY